MDRVRQVFASDDLGAAGDAGHAAVDQARRELRAALIAKLDAAPSQEELQRVADVLRNATGALRRK